MRKTLSFLALTLLAFPLFADHRSANDFSSDYQTVPVVANTMGAGGSIFRTHVALLNPTRTAFNVTADFYDGAGGQHTAVIPLAAGELKTYDNFLFDVFAQTGAGAVTFETDNPAKRFIVNTEIWTVGARNGTTIPPMEFEGTDSPSFAPGISVGTDTRTNVGCFNESNAMNRVTVKVMDKTGSLVLSSFVMNIPANAWSQTGVTQTVSNGYIRFEPSGAAVCYAVVVDNSTNDGHYIPASEYLP